MYGNNTKDSQPLVKPGKSLGATNRISMQVPQYVCSIGSEASVSV
jgi:hypothetical protein